MTAHPPAAKASGVSPPLAFLSSLQPVLSPLEPPLVLQDFSDVISEALLPKDPPAETDALPKMATSGKQAETLQATSDSANLLLALLARSLSVSQPPPDPPDARVSQVAVKADANVSARNGLQPVVETPGWTAGLANITADAGDGKITPGLGMAGPKLIQNSSDLGVIEKKPESISSAGARRSSRTGALVDRWQGPPLPILQVGKIRPDETTNGEANRKPDGTPATMAPTQIQSSSALSEAEWKSEPSSSASAVPPSQADLPTEGPELPPLPILQDWTISSEEPAHGETNGKPAVAAAPTTATQVLTDSALSVADWKPERVSSASALRPSQAEAPTDGPEAPPLPILEDWTISSDELTRGETNRKPVAAPTTTAPTQFQSSSALSEAERKPQPISGAIVAPLPEPALPADDAKAPVHAGQAAGAAGPAIIGTPVAQTNQRMNFSAERNDFAGQTEQKVPPGAVPAIAVAGVDSVSAPRDRKTKPRLQFDWHDTPAQVLTIMDPSGKAVQNARELEGTRTHPAATGAVNRIEMFITSEAVNIRQKGAERVGVSLKVDANTELFLQLTNKDGQVQAALRCERGDFSALESQWTQLQQSLARQNVQLLPLGSGLSSNSQQPSERQPGHLPQREEGLGSSPLVETKQTRAPKPQARARHGWESWA